MLRFVSSLFGCAHQHCTFPLTASKAGHVSATYVVCLDCGKEFPYDWEHMKMDRSAKPESRVVA